MIIKFEELASQPEEVLRKVCAFIGEEYTPAMLTMKGAADHRDKGGNSSFGEIKPGVISKSPIGRFRTVLSKPEIAFIQLFTAREMKALGYSRERVRFSPVEFLKYYLWILPNHMARMFGSMMLTARGIRRGERIPAHRLLDLPVTTPGGYDAKVKETAQNQI